MNDSDTKNLSGRGSESGARILDRLTDFAARFDRQFEPFLTPTGDVPQELVDAMRHCALAPGKRLRPYLVTRCCELAGGDRNKALPAAAAIECVHAFSLIHDDLPAMDDDDLRRGRPTCHKVFGEAVAILAGDALVTLAFELLTRHTPDRALAADLVLELASGAGWAGMIGGQTADVTGESRPASVELAKYIHERKTASLFRSACRLGALAGCADSKTLSCVSDFGQALGRAFQIADDLLDLTSTPDVLGKNVCKDAESNKQTYPRCVGCEESRAAANQASEAAIAALERLGVEANDLRELAEYVVSRHY